MGQDLKPLSPESDATPVSRTFELSSGEIACEISGSESGQLERFLREVPSATGVEVEANHYTVGMAAGTVRAVGDFLDR